MRILITGGAGFVGGSLARHFLHGTNSHQIVLFDNFHRMGSEWNGRHLREIGAHVEHGDVRIWSDLDCLEGSFDLLIEASAEPSVHAGILASPRYVLDTNLGGAINCLEFARRRCGGMIFLSSSRVYSIEALRRIPLRESSTRFEIDQNQTLDVGLSAAGIAEPFSSEAPRSYYGTSKLAAEVVCQEYAARSGLQVVINRCGVIAGPGQFGRTDQGVFTLWVARHLRGQSLAYTGFGGHGKQVRDLLHPEDLAAAIEHEISSWPKVNGGVFNLGGGIGGSVSLLEFTAICREVTGRHVAVHEEPGTNPVDIPWFITDYRRFSGLTGWAPTRSPLEIATEISEWLTVNDHDLRSIIP